MLSLSCMRVPVATTASAQSGTTTVQGGREVAKTRFVGTAKKPEPVNVGSILRAGLPRLVSPPNRQIPWDEVFAPKKQEEEVELDVTHAEPVFVEPKDPIGSRYEIRGELGRGSYGTVYNATEISTGREVAIKEVRRGDGCCVLSDCKIQREIDVLDDLRGCDSVVQLQGSYQLEDKMYIVTELCKGGDLESYLKV